MTDTTPAAAPAAPAAAPAPAAATAAAPAAPAPAAPAAAPAPAPAPAAADPGESLIPADPAAPAPAAAPAQTPEEALAAARKLIADAEAAADPNGGKAWLLTDGVMGQGAKPDWFKADKYKSVAEQAKAYTELEKRFGSFTGAPKNEKGEPNYTFTAPEGIEVDMNHPLLGDFNKWAAEHQLNQQGYNDLLGMLVQYEAAQSPNMAEVKARLGENADTRIQNVSSWVKANLGPDGLATFRAATTGANADAVFKVVEQIVGKSGQVRLPAPGSDVPAAQQGGGLEAIQAKFRERNAQGKLRIEAEPGRRAQLEAELRQYFEGAAPGTQYHGSRAT